VKNLDGQNTSHKISAAYILRAVAKHSPDLAADAVTAGAVDGLKACLEHIDPSVKEAACWALDYISQHNGELAKAVVDAEIVPLLVLAVQEPEVTLKRIAVSCLGNLAKHSAALAQTVLASKCLPHFGTLLDNYVEGRRDVVDNPLKRQICACLAHIAKHSVKFAEEVVNANLLPLIIECGMFTCRVCSFVDPVPSDSALMRFVLMFFLLLYFFPCECTLQRNPTRTNCLAKTRACCSRS